MRMGDIIKEARIKKGISIEELANYVDRSKSAIDMLERYNIMPNFDTACMLCELLNIDIKELWQQVRFEYVNKLKINNKKITKLYYKKEKIANPINEEKARGSPDPGQSP